MNSKAIIETPVQEMNRLHTEICMSVPKAIRIGELLIEQKRKCGYGNWLPWLKTNVIFDRTTATRYMRLFRNEKCCTMQHLGLTDAYKICGIIATPSEEELEEKKQREKELNDEAEQLAKERLAIEKKERELEEQRNGEDIIEVKELDFELDRSFDNFSEPDESDEAFEERVRILLKGIREGEEESRKQKSYSEAKIAGLAKIGWEAFYDQFDKEDRQRIAKATIKMLYKKYPQLMDEVVL